MTVDITEVQHDDWLVLGPPFVLSQYYEQIQREIRRGIDVETLAAETETILATFEQGGEIPACRRATASRSESILNRSRLSATVSERLRRTDANLATGYLNAEREWHCRRGSWIAAEIDK